MNRSSRNYEPLVLPKKSPDMRSSGLQPGRMHCTLGATRSTLTDSVHSYRHDGPDVLRMVQTATEHLSFRAQLLSPGMNHRNSSVRDNGWLQLNDVPSEEVIASAVSDNLESILKIQRSASEFDPVLKRDEQLGLNSRGAARREVDDGDDDEAAVLAKKAMRERFAAYKFYRSIPTHVPPLSRKSLSLRRERSEPHLRWPIESCGPLAMKAYWEQKSLCEYYKGEEVRERARTLMRDRYMLLNEKYQIKKPAISLQSKCDQKMRRNSRWAEFVVVAKFFTAIVEIHQTKANAEGAAGEEGDGCGTDAVEAGNAVQDIPFDSSSVILMRPAFKFILALRRRRAQQVFDSLNRWAKFGNLAIAMKKFQRKVLVMQHFWRSCSKRLANRFYHQTAKWIKLEKSIIKVELERFDSKKPVEDRVKLPMDERVQLALTPAIIRNRHLKHEMTLRRYNLLDATDLWRKKMDSYEEQVKVWKFSREAHAVIGGSMKSLEVPMMPPCPTQAVPLHTLRTWVVQAMKEPETMSPYQERAKPEKAPFVAVEEVVSDEFAFMEEGPPIVASREDLELQRSSIKLPEPEK